MSVLRYMIMDDDHKHHGFVILTPSGRAEGYGTDGRPVFDVKTAGVDNAAKRRGWKLISASYFWPGGCPTF